MTMRRSVLLLLLLAGSFVFRASGQDLDPLRIMSRQELDIVKVRLAQEKAWNAGNLEDYAKAYKDSPEILFVGPKLRRGLAGMLLDYEHNYPTREAMGTLTYSNLEPHILDEKFSVLTGRYHLERGKKAGGNADGIFSLVFEKTDQGWKIVIDHTT